MRSTEFLHILAPQNASGREKNVAFSQCKAKNNGIFIWKWCILMHAQIPPWTSHCHLRQYTTGLRRRSCCHHPSCVVERADCAQWLRCGTQLICILRLMSRFCSHLRIRLHWWWVSDETETSDYVVGDRVVKSNSNTSCSSINTRLVSSSLSRSACNTVFAARCCISAAYAVMRCACVCLSVTFVNCVKTYKHNIRIFSPSGRPIILVFPCQTA